MGGNASPQIEAISAVTLATRDMTRAVAFYTGLGFAVRYGGPASGFTSFYAGRSYINLMAVPNDQTWGQWGRFIIYVSDVDAMYSRALAKGFRPEFPPRDAPWGERYFHIKDPDGHELSFARLLR
ncbi:MAG: VOC family protein [Alphaproteobacteria bacterium]|jgi:catechol 2,3-dioxygenase-like lactoylglutathione lyase family enzyme